MLVWNDDEKDAFAELINVGMGLAASALSSMLGREIFLSVPSVEFISRQEMDSGLAEMLEMTSLACVRPSRARLKAISHCSSPKTAAST
jgi:chemotaxis protein CheC